MKDADLPELLDHLLHGERPVRQLPRLLALAESLEEARKRLHGAGDPVLGRVGSVLQEVWSLEVDQVPPALAADLAAEALALLAEAALYSGCERSGELVLRLAQLAAGAGTGDPFVAVQVFGSWVLLHLNRGRLDQAREAVHQLTQAIEAGRDPRLSAEADLWSYLVDRERARGAEAEQGLRLLGHGLPPEDHAALLARLERRLRFADGGAYDPLDAEPSS